MIGSCYNEAIMGSHHFVSAVRTDTLQNMDVDEGHVLKSSLILRYGIHLFVSHYPSHIPSICRSACCIRWIPESRGARGYDSAVPVAHTTTELCVAWCHQEKPGG